MVDSAAPELIAAIRSEGLTVYGAEKYTNCVFAQITQIVQPRLLDPGDGRPRLSVDPGCANLIRDFESYEWKEGQKDEPVKEHDHALDALRYALKHVHGGDRSGVAMFEPEKPATKPEEAWWAPAISGGWR